MGSLVDQVYRSFIISKFFARGWGNPEQLKKLFEFRRNIANRDACMQLVNPEHPITLDKVELDKSGEFKYIDGHFRSPFADHLPGLLPKVAETAYFQMVVPAKGWTGTDRPLCIQMAGTGDHHFWRRRNLLAKPLLKDHGVSSLMLENPFYGKRKPKEQFRSSLLNVSDIFVMGGSLVLEAIALLNWCQKEGYGPCVLHGISMGGHMAALAAITYNKPVGLVPCLSWSTASGVFTQGVLSSSLEWKTLETQFLSNNFFKEELYNMVWNNSDEAYLAGKEFVSEYQKYEQPSVSNNKTLASTDKPKDRQLLSALTNFLKARNLIKILPDLSILTASSRPNNETETKDQSLQRQNKIKEFGNMTLGKGKSKVQKETINFMRGILDEFTHVRNFATPIDPSLIIAISAKDDAYWPKNDGYEPLNHVWPGCDLRFVDGGHISSYFWHQDVFKKTIAEVVDKYRQKYHPNGTLKHPDENPTLKTLASREAFEVLGFTNPNPTSDSTQRV